MRRHPKLNFGNLQKRSCFIPEKITIDKSGANTAAIRSINADACLDIELRQSKYLNNTVEQDHRAVKRMTSPMMGITSFAEQFYSLAFLFSITNAASLDRSTLLRHKRLLNVASI